MDSFALRSLLWSRERVVVDDVVAVAVVAGGVLVVDDEVCGGCEESRDFSLRPSEMREDSREGVFDFNGVEIGRGLSGGWCIVPAAPGSGSRWVILFVPWDTWENMRVKRFAILLLRDEGVVVGVGVGVGIRIVVDAGVSVLFGGCCDCVCCDCGRCSCFRWWSAGKVGAGSVSVGGFGS